MERIITTALLLSLSLALASGCYASESTVHASSPPRTSIATFSAVCSALLFLRVRRPRGPK